MAAHKMEIAQRKNAEGDGERRPKSEKKKVKGQSHPEFVYAQNGHVDRSKSFELSHWH